MGYKTDATKGVSWIGTLRVVTRVITTVRFAILGRILKPSQFGVYGIASLVLSLLEILTETGINIFLVQEKDESKSYINSAWVVSMLRGTLLAVLLLLIAPVIAYFFHAPDATFIIRLMALVPFIRGFINPHIIYFQKDLQFHKEFWLRVVLFSIDAVVSILVAIHTKSAHSFAWGVIISALFEVLFSYVFIHSWPSLKFELVKVKHVISRGWWVTLTGIFSYFADQGDNIVVGKIMGTGPLGIYQAAYKFSTLPISEITDVVNKVIFPVFVKFSDDKKRLFQAFKKVTLATFLGALVIGIPIFFFAKPLILLLMGEQWVSAVPAIQILIIYGVLRTLFGNFAPVFLSVGRQDYVAWMTFFRVAGLLLTIIPLVSSFGLVGAGYSALFSMCCEIPVALYFAKKIFSQT